MITERGTRVCGMCFLKFDSDWRKGTGKKASPADSGRDIVGTLLC
jgi:hypothetical protein